MADFTGANHKPYRLPAPGMMDLCGRGKFLHAHGEESAPRLVNQTKVLKNVGGVVTSNNPPFARLDPAQHNGGAGAIDGACVAADPGKCGIWLSNGDSGGISEREVDYTLGDDIRPAGAGEAVNDHNAYKADGTKKTFTTCKKQGAKFVHFRKYWHGLFGYTSNDRCTPPDANIGADQTRYLTQLISAKWSQGGSIETHIDQWQSTTPGFPGGAKSGGISESIDLSDAYGGSDERSQQVSTAKLTGINTLDAKVASDATSFTHTQTTTIPGPGPSDGTTVSSPGSSGSYGFAFPRACWIHNTIGCMGVTLSFGGVQPNELYPGSPSYPPISGTPTEINDAVTAIQMFSTPAGTYFQGSVDTLIISPTEITVILKFRPSSTAPFLVTTEGPTIYGWRINESTYTLSGEFTFTLRMSLTNVYTSYECYDHLLTAAAAWDLASDLAYPFRTDEVFATIPAIFYDEVGPTTPSIPIPDTMNDYSLAFDAGNSVWLQRTWLDGQDYYWTINSGARAGKRGIPDTTETATITTALRTGTIVAHTTAGSDRHFWFKFDHVKIVGVGSLGQNIWATVDTGAFSPGNLPETTMRWLNDLESMYDPTTLNRGIWQQEFLHENGGIVTGAKYVETKLKWNGVNFARPYGADKFAVDQNTVCCVNSGSGAGGSIDVQKTDEAVEPNGNVGPVFGIRADDNVIISGEGVFPVTAVTPLGGPGAFTLTLGVKLSDLPAGYQFTTPGGSYVGRARFWSAPPFGKESCSVVFVAGVSTFTFSRSLDYWLDATQDCNLYVTVAGSALASGVTLTRVDGTHATAVGNYSIAKFVAPVGVNVALDGARRNTFVHIAWTFNPRSAFIIPQPPFYVEDCTAISVTQRTLADKACRPSVVGIVPGGSEGFANENLAASGTIAFDSYYGAHSQQYVATAMVDPFWQRPFRPTCGDNLRWLEDNGTGLPDDEFSTPPVKYFAHRPYVEAMSVVPVGASLPAGVYLIYDPDHNIIPPPDYPNGLPLATSGTVDTIYGFWLDACANIASSGRFSGDYSTFVNCL